MSEHGAPGSHEPLGQIMARLREGNHRFAAGEPLLADSSPPRRAHLASGQSPAVAVLACSDSRVAPELIFDQGLGELFVVRVAGNVVDDAVLGSLEYAVEHLGVRLIVVLGHSGCGAVTAACTCTFEDLDQATSTLLKAIEPAVAEARSECCALDELVDTSARINVAAQATALLSGPAIRRATAEGNLTIQGAWYDLSTGRVTWV
jgi:carbonic anhydrase